MCEAAFEGAMVRRVVVDRRGLQLPAGRWHRRRMGARRRGWGGELSVDEYFRMPESLQPMELVYGRVREPPSPRYGHQSAVTPLAALPDQHVRQHDLGQVRVS